MKSKYILLTGALVSFAVSALDLGSTVLVDMGRPVGAILFGLYMIAQVLEKESAILDEQLAEEKAHQNAAKNSRGRNLQEGLTAPALTMANSR